jgi:hypothetical protein
MTLKAHNVRTLTSKHWNNIIQLVSNTDKERKKKPHLLFIGFVFGDEIQDGKLRR